jgi:CRISPR/Cas system endoribonuclease Cas6 (RAMP superfamily)
MQIYNTESHKEQQLKFYSFITLMEKRIEKLNTEELGKWIYLQ